MDRRYKDTSVFGKMQHYLLQISNPAHHKFLLRIAKEFAAAAKRESSLEEELDEMWMNCHCSDNGEPVEDVTEEINARLDLFETNPEEYRKGISDFKLKIKR